MSDKIKKLSQAMKYGATLSEQCYNNLYEFDQQNIKITKTCALGAAFHAIKVAEQNPKILSIYRNYSEIRKRFPELCSRSSQTCPACYRNFTFEHALWQCIVHLNNDHQWTREQIAGWLESQGL